MTPLQHPVDFTGRVQAYAAVMVRIGLNLQPGQRLLIADPYELQGVARDAESVVAAVRSAALAAGCPGSAAIEIQWGDARRLRDFAGKKDWRAFSRLTKANAAMMEQSIRRGDALLFLPGSQPRLMAGLEPADTVELRRIGWEHFGPVAQQLVHGATNWTVAPAPSPEWAMAAYEDLPPGQQLAALWETVFAAMRVPRGSADSGRASGNPSGGRVPVQENVLAAWQSHLAALNRRRDELNDRRLKVVRYLGTGTDLSVTLPPEHVWCTARLTTAAGVPFVANLPTEEIFTLPHKDSATGSVRVAGPVSYGGAVIEGIELEFKRGRVERARARTGHELLARLLETDEGAARLGEVALVETPPPWASPTTAPGPAIDVRPANRFFRHPLLDENAAHHIALGEAYGFCLRSPNPRAMNRSLVHLDLPVDATIQLA